jgi:putative OPT family oligopeptide transporter
MHDETPYIPADASIDELTFRGIVLAILLTVMLAVSNAYLALKLGILTSASIPAAMISIGILRFFKGSTILENNAVQTAASAGEAVAGGIVYTIPGLVVIGYWNHFDYVTNFLIALAGGVLGVLFSIPLRKILVNEKALRFPEGRAIAEVLKSSVEKTGLRSLAYGGFIGGGLELFQLGFKIIASSWSYWFVVKRSLFTFGAGFSATMIGAGFLIGHDMACSIFLGAVLAWVFALPLLSQFYPELITQYSPTDAGVHLWNGELRYIGIGAMLFAGIWTFSKLLRPLLKSVYTSMHAYRARRKGVFERPRTDRDIPMPYIVMGISLMTGILFLLFQFIFPLDVLGLPDSYGPTLIFFSVLYVLIIGFLFSVITAYFSGMVGVSASPGSSVVITGVLIAAWLLLCVMNHIISVPFNIEQIRAAEAITIIVGSVVTGIAAIANDNTQDLKVGQLIGATPWKQQLMLLLGVLVSALVIPLVMQLMFSVYGIAGVMPREGMDVAQSLPAPTAALLAAVSEAVFRGQLPWEMMFIGVVMIIGVISINRLLNLQRFIKLSMLGIAIGMYLPLTTSFPLFIGGMIALWVKRRLHTNLLSNVQNTHRMQIGTLIACGLVAGAALMDVVLAFAFSILHGPDGLSLVGEHWNPIGVCLGGVSMALLALWIKHRVCSRGSD